MKHSIISSFVIFFALSANVYGEDCNLEIRDGAAAQDLSRVLHCLDQRLKNLEIKASDSDKSGGIVAARNPAEFDAKTFAVSVRSASKQGGQNGDIYIALSIRNKTTEQSLLAINTATPPALIDEETGTSVTTTNAQNTILGVYAGNSGATQEQSYTPIPANTIFNFGLRFDGSQIKGKILSLNLNLMNLNHEQAQRITAPLSVTLKN